MEKIEIILHDNGRLTERTIRERDLQAEDEVLEALTEAVTRQQRNVMPIPGWGLAHANISLHDTLWSVPITRLPLKARFKLINGVLVPMFASTTELEMPLVWYPPKEIRLVFVVQTEPATEHVGLTGNWLFALNQSGNGFRLPLPNLYDDCKVCTGAFATSYDSAQAAIVASLGQFSRSQWNSDLMRTVAQSQSFFRFQPTNETFETLPCEAADWTTLCNKVATAILDRVIL